MNGVQAMWDEVRSIEEHAGVAEKARDAQVGPMFRDLDLTPRKYFDGTEDYARRRVRALYLGSPMR